MAENPFGFVRVTAASHTTHVAQPLANARAATALSDQFPDSDVLVCGELSLTGYTCGDLFGQQRLLQEALAGLVELVAASKGRKQLLVVGLPVLVGGSLYNAAAAICDGQVLGVVPKQFLPNYQEFYEMRWFAAADGSEPASIELGELGEVPFGIDLLFQCGELIVGIEICEDLWMAVPPSSLQAGAGANLLLNLSASNEIVGKASYRELLVRSQSADAWRRTLMRAVVRLSRQPIWSLAVIAWLRRMVRCSLAQSELAMPMINGWRALMRRPTSTCRGSLMTDR